MDYHDSSNEADNGADKGLGSNGSLVVGSNQLNSKYYDYRAGEIPQMSIDWKMGEMFCHVVTLTLTLANSFTAQAKQKSNRSSLTGCGHTVAQIPLVDVAFESAVEQTLSGSNRWSGLIGGFLFNPSYTAILPDSMFTYNDTGDFLDSFSGGGSDLMTNYYYTFDFDELAAISEAFLTNDVLGGDDYLGYPPTTLWGRSPAAVEEITDSIYVDSNWASR